METIGPEFLGGNAADPGCPRIATLYPRQGCLVSVGTSHFEQRDVFRRWLEGRHPEMETEAMNRAVRAGLSLFRQGEFVLIRVDGTIEEALAGDAWLQQPPPAGPGLCKSRIRFVVQGHQALQDELRRRGELWRMAPAPRTPKEVTEQIRQTRVGLAGEAGYVYHSPYTGTRFLTVEGVSSLLKAGDAGLVAALTELSRWVGRSNRRGNPELELLGCPLARLWPEALDRPEALPVEEQRRLLAVFAADYQRLCDDTLHRDALEEDAWRGEMFLAQLGLAREEHTAEHVLRGLSPEYFLQVEWLPGGLFVDREFVFDSLYGRPGSDPAPASPLCRPTARAIISNYIREYTNIKFLNLGRVNPSLHDRPGKTAGRREVYLVELQFEGETTPHVEVLRFQKWGLRERLDDGEKLEQAFIETDQYTEYILDRRLGCRQLGMNLPASFTMHRIEEIYTGEPDLYRGQRYLATYFARAYIRGIASDKIPRAVLMRPRYAVTLASLLGAAAASNLIVGRVHPAEVPQVIFDSGDEIILEDEATRLPSGLVVGDHSSTFNDYKIPLQSFIREYARPVTVRVADIPEGDRRAFREAYAGAFETGFRRIQTDYASRPAAFDGLFAWARHDPNGSFAYRWERVLERLRNTDATPLFAELRHAIGL